MGNRASVAYRSIRAMSRLQASLDRQPWLFVFLAVGFGGLQYLGGWLQIISTKSVWAAAADGLIFALLMSVFFAVQGARRQRTPNAKPPLSSTSDE
jgi:membrane associated rhomboid family serine protease